MSSKTNLEYKELIKKLKLYRVKKAESRIS